MPASFGWSKKISSWFQVDFLLFDEEMRKVTTVAGAPDRSGFKDGRGSEALFNWPKYCRFLLTFTAHLLQILKGTSTSLMHSTIASENSHWMAL